MCFGISALRSLSAAPNWVTFRMRRTGAVLFRERPTRRHFRRDLLLPLMGNSICWRRRVCCYGVGFICPLPKEIRRKDPFSGPNRSTIPWLFVSFCRPAATRRRRCTEMWTITRIDHSVLWSTTAHLCVRGTGSTSAYR